MYFYNKKIGVYTAYYNTLLYSYILPYSNTLNFLYYKKNKENISCILVYPILHKKIFFFQVSTHIVKKKKMKKSSNLNQSLILESSISSYKCIYTIPIFSLSNNLFLE